MSGPNPKMRQSQLPLSEPSVWQHLEHKFIITLYNNKCLYSTTLQIRINPSGYIEGMCIKFFKPGQEIDDADFDLEF